MSAHEPNIVDQAIERYHANKPPKTPGPRITQEDVDSVIACESYHRFIGTTLTVCCLTLKNGYCVTGESACVSMDNYDQEMGEFLAKEKAKEKIWALEGYLLKEKVRIQTEIDAALDAMAKGGAPVLTEVKA